MIKGSREGAEYECNIHAGIKCIGSTTEILTDYVILAYDAWHGIQVLYKNNKEGGSKG